jgi:hypothetical protein
VRPCKFAACYARFPYRVVNGSVKFLTFECDEGGSVVSAFCVGGGTETAARTVLGAISEMTPDNPLGSGGDDGRGKEDGDASGRRWRRRYHR